MLDVPADRKAAMCAFDAGSEQTGAPTVVLPAQPCPIAAKRAGNRDLSNSQSQLFQPRGACPHTARCPRVSRQSAATGARETSVRGDIFA